MLIFQLGVPTCQRCANFSTWHANVPNGVPVLCFGGPTCQNACQFFKLFNFYEMLREISIRYYYIKNSTSFYSSHDVCFSSKIYGVHDICFSK